MPTMKRFKTDYVGVYYIKGTAIGTGKPEKIFYITYRKDRKLIEEKAGRQYQDDMTPAKASKERAKRIDGKESNKERRERKRIEKAEKDSIWTIKKLWESYKENKTIKGIVTDANRFDKHIDPIMAEKQPHELSPFDIDRLRLKMQKTHKPATVKNTLELVRRIINYGIKKQVITPLPFKVEMPKVNNLKTEDLTAEQLQALLKAIDEDPHPLAGPLMKVALFTGMRRGSLFSLKWTAIDFEKGFISIVNPKGGKDEKIPLNTEARKVLETLPRNSEYVFPGRDGERRVDIHKAVNNIKTKAGLPKDFRALHGLRHTYASMLASSGEVDIYTLEKLLLHKSLVMTQRYAHLRDETLKRASELMGNLVAEASKVGEKSENVKELRKK